MLSNINRATDNFNVFRLQNQQEPLLTIFIAMVDYKNKRGVKHSSFLGQIDYVVYSEYIVWEYASITGNLLFNIIIISHLPVLGVGDFSFYW